MKSSSEIDHQKTVERVACIILLIYPTLMLSVKGGMNAAFLSMLLLVFVVWIHRPVGIGRIEWKSDWTIYVVAMFAMTVAIIISQAYHQQFAARHHDGASRYWLAIPVFLLLYRLDLKVFSTLPFAFPLAAIAGWLLTKDLGGRSGVSTLDLIHFGDFALMLGVLSLLSINWISKDSLAEIAFKIFGFIAGITASFGSGSRGGWLAIPLFIVVVVYFNSNTKSIKRVVLISIVGTLLSVSLLYTLNNQFQQRVSQLLSEASSLNQGDQDTSVGIRWQLYKAAGQIILDHPLFGVGPRGFALQMAPMAEAGKITPMAAELGRGEVHNDILNKAAGMGLGGLLAILAVYLVPIWLFSKASRATSSQIKRAGIMGVVFVSGFLVFGLTAEILNLTLAIAFYSFTLAVLLAYCYNTHHAEQGA